MKLRYTKQVALTNGGLISAEKLWCENHILLIQPDTEHKECCWYTPCTLLQIIFRVIYLSRLLILLHYHFKLLERKWPGRRYIANIEHLQTFLQLYSFTHPSPSRSPLSSNSLTWTSDTFPLLFIISRNSASDTFPSPFLSKPKCFHHSCKLA